MTKEQHGNSTKRKRGGLWQLLLLGMILGAGTAYLEGQGFEWNQQLAALQGWYSYSPPVKQVETPTPTQSSAVLQPSFDLASADETGKLVAAGRGEAGWIIRLLSKTQVLGETKADENDEWVLTPEQPLAPGEHTLSLLAIDPLTQRSLSAQRSITLSIAPRRQAGTKSAGTEIATAELSSGTGQDCKVATVKRGDTLWQMAHRCYGNGTKYSIIFQSNRPLVRNPNLIYPDQQLALPH
jgi:nucleoid-associated protein YgaU